MKKKEEGIFYCNEITRDLDERNLQMEIGEISRLGNEIG